MLIDGFKYTENFIQQILCKSEILKNNLVCENVSHILHGQCDVLSMNKTGYLSEFEIKTSRQDFLVDKKKDKFLKKHQYRFANYFYYVCPKDLIKLADIDKNYGLLYIDGEKITIKRKAKLIHIKKQKLEKIYLKFIRLYSERKFLGCAKLTYLNNENKKRNKQLLD